jgi:hypothetical protein
MMKTGPENLKRPADLALDLDTLTEDLDYFHELIFVDELARLRQSGTSQTQRQTRS